MTLHWACIEAEMPLMQHYRVSIFGNQWVNMYEIWVRRYKHCIRFKSTQPKHGPMHIRLYNYPFHTIGIDYVGELPVSPSGNKYILTAVCPFSNFLITVPVPNKNATTAARALLDQVFFKFGFPEVIQSDRGAKSSWTPFCLGLPRFCLLSTSSPLVIAQTFQVSRNCREIPAFLFAFTDHAWSYFLPAFFKLKLSRFLPVGQLLSFPFICTIFTDSLAVQA